MEDNFEKNNLNLDTEEDVLFEHVNIKEEIDDIDMHDENEYSPFCEEDESEIQYEQNQTGSSFLQNHFIDCNNLNNSSKVSFENVNIKEEIENDDMYDENIYGQFNVDGTSGIKIEDYEIESSYLEDNDEELFIDSGNENEDKNVCHICQKTFSSKYNLEDHIKYHFAEEIEKKFSCDICNENFVQKSVWWNHMLRHREETSFQCPVCCKQFLRNMNLQQHLMSHTGVEYFTCSYCKQPFVDRTLCLEHENEHKKRMDSNDNDTTEEQILETSPDIVQSTSLAADSLLSLKSKSQYERQYKLFMDWCLENKTASLSENVLLTYFQKLSTKMKPSSLWAMYSMLRMTIKLKDNVDISKYTELCAFLRRTSIGYKPKRSKILTPRQIQEFVSSAPDEKYLFTKVGIIFGVMGACRREELMKMEISHIEDLQTALLVHIPDAKNETERQFVIGGNFYNICKKYMDLRPPNLKHCPRFFLNFQKGKCTKQPVGINKFGILASQVAEFLKLPEPNLFTGHCLRRSSTTNLVHCNTDINTLNRYRERSSTSVAESNIDHSLNNKAEMSNKILHSIEDTSIERNRIIENIKSEKMDSNDNDSINKEQIPTECPSGTTQATADDTLPTKSKTQYERQYKLFMDWCLENESVSLSENVLLTYFKKLSTKIKPSSLWSIYSMLRMTINLKDNVDISKYSELSGFLKRTSIGYKPEKSKILTPRQIQEFVSFAPDDKYLFTKVGIIFGVMGACRREELMKMEISHIEDLQTALLVHIPDAKTKTERQFVIGGYFYNICKKYMELRPPDLKHVNRFFLNYQKGKCTKQPVGINKFGILTSQVAEFLKLPEPNLYTGHCLRRSSTTNLVQCNTDITTLNSNEEWSSTSAAESNVDHSLNNKAETTNKILHSVEDTSIEHSEIIDNIKSEKMDSNDKDATEEQILGTSSDIKQAATLSTDNILPTKSKIQYERQYKNFMDWCLETKTISLSENVLLTYFENLSTKVKPSSLWSIYSMLRMTINLKNNIDISKYTKLCAFLKQTSNGYKPKKTKILTPQQIKEFLLTAPDEKYLFTKVGLIFGIMGACRRDELMKIETSHVEDLQKALVVHIFDSETKIKRQFVIGGSFYIICKKYMALRPPNLKDVTRFFLNFQRGKCTKQTVGINKFGTLASQVAAFLKLPEPNSYTGHSLRRSSTMLVDSGADITILKRHGGRGSTSVAQGFVDQSLNNKM